MPFTYAVRNAFIDDITTTAPYISLHSADPGNTGANELSGNGYARSDATGKFDAASNAMAANNDTIDYGPANTSNWSQATYFGFWTAPTGGTFKGGFELATPQTVSVPNTASFDAGDLVVSVS